MYTTFTEIESEYRKKVESVLENKNLSAALWVGLASELFHEFKIKGISDTEIYFADVLLYQCGVCNWYDEFGEHFSFDITRQFIEQVEHEPYQLTFSLIYEPEQFKEVGNSECWSADFADFDSFISSIKADDGFKLANKFIPKSYKIIFEQC